MTRRKNYQPRVLVVGDYFMSPEQFRTVREAFQWMEQQIDRSTNEARWKMDAVADVLYIVKQTQQVKE